MRTHACGELRAAHAGEDVDPLRLGGAPPRPRRRDLHRPARPRGRRAARVPPRGRARGARRRAGPARASGCPRARARCALRPEGMVNPELADRRGRDRRRPTLEVLARAETPPFPIEDRIEVGEDLRLQYRYLDLRRPEMTKILRAARTRSTAIIREHMDARGFLEVETPAPHAQHARGRARLPRALAPVPGDVLRAAAVAAAAEAAADGGRAGPLLPDRAVPPRRGPARRPRLRVHAARRRDVLRRRGGPLRADRAAVRADRARDRRASRSPRRSRG